MAKKQTPETRITNEIKAILTKFGYVTKKLYNGGVSKRFDHKTNQIRFMKKPADGLGVPDLFAYSTKESSYLWIEVKSPTRRRKLSPEQKEFLQGINRVSDGSILGICCSDSEALETFLEKLETINLIKLEEEQVIYLDNKSTDKFKKYEEE